MKPYVYFNGRIVPESRARVSVFDRGLLHGFGLFETLRAYGGRPFRLAEHLRRMAASARWLNISKPLPAPHIRKAVIELLKLNRLKDAAVRITLTAGVEETCLPNLIVTTRPMPDLPDRLYREGARILVADWPRVPTSPLYGHKTLNYLENILVRQRAKSMGALEMIFTDDRGRVLEGSASNVFMVRRNVILTPPIHEHILPGITRRDILTLCAREGMKLKEQPLLLKDLCAADEVFITNSLIEVMPVRQIDRARIASGQPGPVTMRLLALYRQDVQAE